MSTSLYNNVITDRDGSMTPGFAAWFQRLLTRFDKIASDAQKAAATGLYDSIYLNQDNQLCPTTSPIIWGAGNMGALGPSPPSNTNLGNNWKLLPDGGTLQCINPGDYEIGFGGQIYGPTAGTTYYLCLVFGILSAGSSANFGPYVQIPSRDGNGSGCGLPFRYRGCPAGETLSLQLAGFSGSAHMSAANTGIIITRIG